MTATVQKIPLALVDFSPSQPRTDLGDIAELATKLRARGQDKPIDARAKGKRYELADGERRVRAARLLEWTEIDAIVIDATDLDVALRHLSSNDGEPLKPMEEGRAYAHLQLEHGLTEADIADKIGRASSHVRSRLLLTKLHPELQAMFEAGRIKFASVNRLAHTSQASQEEIAEALGRLYPIGPIRTLDVVHALEHLTHRLDAAPFDITSDTLTTAGSCVPCIHNTATQAAQLTLGVGEASYDELPPTCDRRECYADKTVANEMIERADAEKAGIRIMDESEMGLTLDAGRVRPNARWVAVDEAIDDTAPLTWRELEISLAESDKDGLGYASERLAMAFDHGRSILLMESDYAEPFIRASYPKRAAQLRGEPDPDVAAARDAKKAEKEKDAAQAEIDAECVARLIAGATKKAKPKTQEHFAILLLEVLGGNVAKSIAKRRELALEDGHRAITPHEAVARLVSTSAAEEQAALTLEMVVTAHLADVSLPSKMLGSLLHLYGVDPKEVRKELAREKRNVRTRKPKKGASDAAEAPAE